MSKREEQQKQTENREWQNLSHQGRVEGEHVLEGDEPWGAGEQLLSSTQISSLCRIQQLVALELHCRERERREETTCNRHHFRCSCRLFNVPIISIHKYIARDRSLETKLYTLRVLVYLGSLSRRSLFMSEVERSRAVLEWQLGMVGSAPWLNRKLHTSILHKHHRCTLETQT